MKKVIKNLMVQHHPCRYKDSLKNPHWQNNGSKTPEGSEVKLSIERMFLKLKMSERTRANLKSSLQEEILDLPSALHYCRQKNASNTYQLRKSEPSSSTDTFRLWNTGPHVYCHIYELTVMCFVTSFSVIHANQLTLFHTIKLNSDQDPVVQK